MLRFVICLMSALILASCAGGQSGTSSVGRYKVGKPYQVKGVWYYPKEEFDYDETGIASWYGPGFHGKTTANGETYDENELTAAHKTLQMPALVRVTNLDNGRSVVVRLNDRGPYYPGRIIDMSRKGAQLLGFENKGTAKVRVEVLENESRQLAEAARAGNTAYDVAGLNDGGPVPTAAPRPKVTVSGGPIAAPAPPVTAPPPPAPAYAPVEVATAVPGRTVDGRFLPAPEVERRPVRPNHENIYVQAGAFTMADNARRLSGSLSSFGPTQVSQVNVDGKRFYRVRIGPLASVESADGVLDRVIGAGHAGAKIIVD